MSVDLRVDWCDYQAAKYAVMHWHYSKAMPAGKTAKMGVWENGEFVGAVLYSWGANNNIGKPYGLKQVEVCELVRVALTKHESPVSRVVSTTVRMLKVKSPGLRLIVSYADPLQKHTGAIYQAMNWVYVGRTTGTNQLVVDGRQMHKRTASSVYGTFTSSVLGGRYVYPEQKHKYLYPLDRAMRKQIAPLAKPYPKREPCGQGVEGDASGVQSEGAGSIPADRS